MAAIDLVLQLQSLDSGVACQHSLRASSTLSATTAITAVAGVPVEFATFARRSKLAESTASVAVRSQKALRRIGRQFGPS